MFDPRYVLFYDNHTQEQVFDCGVNFDPEAFVEQVKRCGVDFLTVHARCNRGFAYYPTRIGTVHPALKQDMVGGVAKACEKNNIKLAIYFNGGLSGVEAVQHPDWKAVYADGNTMLIDAPANPFTVRMCLNSPYREHLKAMIAETAQMYPYVSGVFIDCVHSFPCYCPYCKAKLAELGLKTHEELGEHTLRDFCADVGELVFKSFPGGELFYNSNSQFRYAGKYNTFLDCECLPTAGWGYECLPTLVHWAPELRPGKTVLNMTGRFYDWGDFGGLRSVNSLSYDLFYGLMHGMRPEIGGHMNPKGDLDMPVFDTIAETYAKLRRFENYYTNAPRNNDIALVLSSEEEMQQLYKPVRAAVRMLEELKLPFSIITAGERSLDSFKVVILPENTEFPEHLLSRLENYKGSIIGIGTGTAQEAGELFGVEYRGAAAEPAYFDAPGMALSIYSGADNVDLLPGAQGGGALIKPYCSPGFEKGMALSYYPPEGKSGFPLEVRKGKNLFCAGHIFSGYYERGALHLRDLLKKFLDEVLPAPQFKSENLYSFTRISVADAPGRRLICLLNYVPEARGNAFAVEDEIELHSAKIAVRLDGFKVEKVLCGADRKVVPFTLEDGYCCVKVPAFKGFTALELMEK